MMKRLGDWAAVCILLGASGSLAVDGLVASIKGDEGGCPPYHSLGTLYVFEVHDDQVVNKTLIHDGCSRWPTFNIEGTHIAFVRYESGDAWVSVIASSGGEVRDLVEIATDADGFNDKGHLSWPSGDWIYYNGGGRNDEGARYIRRVNWQTGIDEPVVTLEYAVWQWNLSADATRASLDVHEKDAPHNSHVQYEFPGDGLLGEDKIQAYGCNNSISPSGNWFLYTTDAGHVTVQFNNWEKDSGFAVTSRDYNAWGVNTDQIAMVCGEDTITVGKGFQDNRYSANSDDWFCLGVGWPGNGRFGECGKNTVLCSPKYEKSIMVTFSERGNGKSGGRFKDKCDRHSGDDVHHWVGGHFWVCTEEDINPDLRDGIQCPDFCDTCDVSWQIPTYPEEIAVSHMRAERPHASRVQFVSNRMTWHVSARTSGVLRIVDTRGRTVRALALHRDTAPVALALPASGVCVWTFTPTAGAREQGVLCSR